LGEFTNSDDAQERAAFATGASRLLLAQGDPAGALRVAQIALDTGEEMGFAQEYWKEPFVTALEAALLLEDEARANDLLGIIDRLPPGRRAQFFQAQTLRFRARLAARTGESDADRLFKGAAGLFRELAMPFYLAVTQLEHAEWLAGHDRRDEAEPLLTEACETFERLEATPWSERMDALAPRGATAATPA
jgi:hypothetical protein